MGQHYLLVNLDRREYISPFAFQIDGKLMSMVHSSTGVLGALAILTADANSRGGGDCYRQVDWNQAAKQPPKNWEPQAFEVIEAEWFVEACANWPAKKVRTIGPSFAGRWAGDRIVTAGEYGDNGKFVNMDAFIAGYHEKLKQDILATNRQQKERYTEALARWDPYYRSDPPTGRPVLPVPVHDMSLELRDQVFEPRYHLQQWAYDKFMDITDMVVACFKAYNLGSSKHPKVEEPIREVLERILIEAYPWRTWYPGTMKKPGDWKYRLYWMTPETLDYVLMQFFDEKKDLAYTKKWLLKQVLLPWQREVLPHYHGIDRKGERIIDRPAIAAVLRNHGIEKVDGVYNMPPLLPDEEHLRDAITTSLARRSPPIKLAPREAYEDSLTPRPQPTTERTRVIDLHAKVPQNNSSQRRRNQSS